MFRKIVSQLSLSPSAVSQLTFYARRLRQEEVTRTFSAIGAALVIGLQAVVILAPPTPSNAASPSDIIYGGIVSKDDLLNHYDSSDELKSIYARLGISRSDIEHTNRAHINTLDRSLKSIGRVPHTADEVEVKIGAKSYYMQPLHTWDTGANVRYGSDYDVLEGTRSSDGSYFAVMFRCGNIVSKTYPPAPVATPAPTPKPTPVPTPAPTATAKPKATPKPSVACSSLAASGLSGSAPFKVDFTGAGTATGQTVTGYEFNYGDQTVVTSPTPTSSHTYTSAGTFVATLKVTGSAGAVSSTAAACTATITVTSVPPSYTKSKTALNITQNIDATTKPAMAGDVVTYQLTTKNIGGSAGSYTVVEHVADILEYATITDAGSGNLRDGVITWPAQTIAPGQAVVQKLTVTIKDPIPATPVGLSDSRSYDLLMDNVYGNGVRISLTPPAAKQIETAATNLPDTGAGTATLIVLAVSCVSLFFYFRNRQLIAEVKLLRGQYQTGGF